MPAQHQHINIVVVSVLTCWCWRVSQSSALPFIFTVEVEGKSLKSLLWIPVSYRLFVQERQNQRMCHVNRVLLKWHVPLILILLCFSTCLSPFPSIPRATDSFSPWPLSYCLDSRGTRGIPHAVFRCCSLFSCADELPAQPSFINVSCHLVLALQARLAYRQNSSSLNLHIPLNLIGGRSHSCRRGTVLSDLTSVPIISPSCLVVRSDKEKFCCVL